MSQEVESGFMALAGLLILLQYFYNMPFVAFLAFYLVIVSVLIALVYYGLEHWGRGGRQHDREGWFDRHLPPQKSAEPSASESEEEAAPPLPIFFNSRGRTEERWTASTDWKAADTASSPVGGTCLACGAKVTEETSTSCPKCGAERQRCPICQRYVAGGQDLLACVHCRTPGHANEMLAWVEAHGTCPYCAHRIDRHALNPPPVLTRRRRRKR